MDRGTFPSQGISQSDVKRSENETPDAGARGDVSALVKIGRFGLGNAATCAFRCPFLHRDPDQKPTESRGEKHDGDESLEALRARQFPDHSEKPVDRDVKTDSDKSAKKTAQNA